MDANSRVDLLIQAFHTQFNPHFVFNSLNIVQHFIITGDKKAALSSLKQFSQLVRHYMRYYGQERTPVQDEVLMLQAYLHLQELRYQDKIELFQDFSEAQPLADQSLPSMMMVLVLEGVLENMLQTGRKDLQVSMRLKARKRTLELLVESNAHPLVERTGGAVPTYRMNAPDWRTQLDRMNLLDDCPVHYLEFFSPPESQMPKYTLKLSLELL